MSNRTTDVLASVERPEELTEAPLTTAHDFVCQIAAYDCRQDSRQADESLLERA